MSIVFEKLAKALPGRRALLHATLLWAPVLVLSMAAKVHKLLRMKEHWSALDAGSVLAHDALWVGTAWMSAAVILSWRAGRLRTTFGVLPHVKSAVWGLLAGMEHAYFMATGAVPDGYMLKEVLTRWEDVRTAIGSEMTPLRVAIMALPVAYACVAVPLGVRALARRWPTALRADAISWRGPIAAAVGVALALTVGFALRPATDAAHVLERNPVAGVFVDLADAFGDEDAEWKAFTVGAMDPITLSRTGEARAKNLLVITLESVSAKATSLYADTGYEPSKPTTPFLETLGKGGAVVERAYAVVPHTSKALVAIHCGAYPKFTPVVAEAEPGGIPVPCLARLLRGEGYATGFFQAAEENYEDRSDLIREFGFETFVGKESLDGRGFDEASYFGWEDDVLIEPSVAWMKRQKKPFFAAVLSLTSHHPYAVPRGYPTTRYVADRQLNDYLNTVAYTDRFLEKLFGALQAAGLLEETMVVVSGDHGEAFGEHGRYQHDTAVYEENVRVPFVLAGAGVVPGHRIGGLRQLIDVMPTALEVLGFQPSRGLLGRSLFSDAGHGELYVHCYFQKRCRAILDGSTKFIDNYAHRGMEVYDLEKDPPERENLFGTHPDLDHRARTQREKMDRIAGETNATYVVQAKERIKAFVSKARPKVGRPLVADFGPVEIVAVDVTPTEISVGGRVDVTVVYHVKERVDDDLRTFMHVAGDRSWFNADHDPVGGAYPVGAWQVGDYILDQYSVSTRPDHPTGEYEVLTGFWRTQEGRISPKTVAKVDRQKRLVLGRFRVKGEEVDLAQHVLAAEPPLPNPVDVRFGDWFRLRSSVVDKPEIKGGLKVTFTYVFEVLKALPRGASFKVRVEGPSGFSRPHVPVNGAHPLSAWKPGEFIVDDHGLITKTRDRAGHYRVMLELHVDGERVRATGKGLPIADSGSVEVGGYTLLPGAELR